MPYAPVWLLIACHQAVDHLSDWFDVRQQAEARTFPLLLMFGEGLPAAPDPAAALAAALPGLHDAAALVAATQVMSCMCSRARGRP